MLHSNNHAEIIIPQNEFYPDSEINGIVKWNLIRPPKQIDLSLFWKTSGRGDPDGNCIITLKLPKKASHEQEFTFKLPNSPYSFSGQLISLQWYLRFKSISPTMTVTENLIVSPTGKEIILTPVENQKLTRGFVEPA